MDRAKTTGGKASSEIRTDGPGVESITHIPQKSINVLLLMEGAEQAQRLEAMLAQEGNRFGAETVDRLSSAVERLGKGGIDVVLVDLPLCDRPGLEALTKIWQSAPYVPIVVLTDGEAFTSRDLLAAGAHDYLVKERIDEFWLAQLLSNAAARSASRGEKGLGEAYFRALVEHSTDGILVIAVDGTVVYDSPGLKGMLGYGEGENVGAQGFDFVHPDDIAKVTQVFAQVVSTPGRSMSAEFRVKHKEGTWRIVEGTSTNHLKDPKVKGVVVNFRDITERKHVEEVIRSSEEKFRTIFDAANDGMVFIDNQARVVDANAKAQAMLGCTRDEVVGKNVFELNLIAPEEMGRLVESYTQMASGGAESSSVLEILGLRKDGTRVPLEISDTVVRDASGNMAGMLAIMRDITERKTIEEKLRQSEQRFRALIEKSEDCILIVGSDGKMIYASPSFDSLFTLEGDDIMGLWVQAIHPDDMPKIVDLFTQCSAEPGATMSAELRVKDKKGVWHYLEGTATNYLQDPAVGGVVVNLRDITERKQAEEAVLDRERRFRNLFTNVNDVVVFADMAGKLTDVNDRVMDMFGYSRDEVVGLSFMDLPMFSKETLSALATQFVQAITEQKAIQPLEDVPANHRDGCLLNLELSSCTLSGSQGEVLGFISVIRNITERKRMEKELRLSAETLSDQNVQLEAARHELAELNQGLEQKVKERTSEVENLLKQKDEFIRQLGHDLKSPLTPLVALLPLMREDMQDPEQQEMMDAAIQNVNFMRDLVVKTLKLARLTSGKVGPTTAKAKMRKQLDTVLRGRKSVADKKGVKIETSVDEGIVVQLEEIDIQELFDNTMTNAIKFTPEGGTVFINAVVSEPYVTVSVRDTGIGMTGEQLSRLFHEFYKADTSRHELDSSGLGLSICKRIVERAGGKIWAESEGPGKGSTFFFTLPLSRVDSGSGEGESGVKNREGAAGQPTMIEYAAEPMATEESDRSAADLSGRSEHGR